METESDKIQPSSQGVTTNVSEKSLSADRDVIVGNFNDVQPLENGGELSRSRPSADSEDIDLWSYRKKPINGTDCFFSEATFCKVMGPEPSFEEKILSQLSRIKAENSEKKKKKRKDVDRPKDDTAKVIKAVTEIRYKDLNQQEDVQPPPFSVGKIAKRNVNALEYDSHIYEPLPIENDDVPPSPAVSSSPSKNNCCLNTPESPPVIPHVEDLVTVEIPTISVGDSKVELQHQDCGVEKEKVKTPVIDWDQNDSGKAGLLSGQVEEMCLVMPSVYSDEDDEENDDKSVPYLQNKNVADAEAIPTVSKTVFSESEVVSEDKGTNLYGDTTRDIHNMSDGQGVRLSPSSSNSVKVNQYAVPWQNVMHEATNMKSQTYSVHQHEAQMASYANAVYSDSSYQVPLSQATSWSENDIPIFSVKEDTPKSDEQPTESSFVAKHRKQNASWSMDKSNTESSKKNIDSLTDKSTAAAKEAVKKVLKFKQSDLTKAEHEKYLKLFNKYVRPYMLGGRPPIFTEQQLNELTVFEKLQRQVLDEQTEFQSYLQESARRNPQKYSFMKTAARHYASAKARSYHLNKKSALRYSSSFKLKIPLNADRGSAELTYQQTLLEVGIPPRITLPDIQSGNKPVPIPHDTKKIDSWFPRQSEKNVPGFIHHEPVSVDPNVKTLAMKYNTQVVMSSSVVKCLMDNQGPSYDRAWDIPVTVLEHRVQGKPLKIIYLDKPLIEDNLLMRDYNHLFHKYALRTFVSHPKQKPSHGIKTPVVASLARDEGGASAFDDPFDMFSTNVDDLETFGTGLNKIANAKHEVGDSKHMSVSSENSPIKKLQTKKWKDLDIAGEESDIKSNSVAFESKLRSGKKIIFSQNDTSKGDTKLNEKQGAKKVTGNKETNHLFTEPKEVFVPRRITRSKALEEASGNQSSMAEAESSKKDGNSNGELDGNTDSNMATGHEIDGSIGRVAAKGSLVSSKKSPDSSAKVGVIARRSKRSLNQVLEAGPRQTEKESIANSLAIARKRASSEEKDISGEEISLKNQSLQNETAMKDDSVCVKPQGNRKRKGELMSQNCDVETCDRSEPGKALSSEELGKSVKLSCIPLSTETCTPLSPFSSPPSSPPVGDIDNQTHSSVQEIPSSPVVTLHSSTPVTVIPLSPQVSPAKQGNQGPSSSNPYNTKVNQRLLDRAGDKFFSPLDSILGPSFGQTLKEERSPLSQEDPCQYLHPREKCSSLVYNLWTIGTVRVLIRCRCHGILKDRQKSKCVYLNPKLEYQTSHGLEQVTVSEVARNWTACYIRPNTNLLRARVNAFTSEIMLLEELQPHQILQSSLNFKPQESFAFLSNVIEQLFGLDCGKYLLSHESGASFCGIRCHRQEIGSERSDLKLSPPKKRETEASIPWIPIDPTILLPHHTANNRIPATFLPKDFVITNPKGGGHKKGKGNSTNGNKKKDNSTDPNIKGQGYYKKMSKKKKKGGK